jgi:hypothetical protein
MAHRLALALTLGAGLAALAADAPPAAPPTTERLIEQLGSPDYKARATATRTLEARGEAALPALRLAQNHPDLEVRQRLTALIASVERAALLAPKRVTLHAEQKPLPEVMAELAKQTGYRLDLQAGMQRSPVTLHADNAPFWPTLDKLCAQAGLIVHQHHDAQGGLMFYPQNSYVPFIDYQGPFRLSAGGFHYSKSLTFATLPRNAAGGGQRSESLSFNFQVLAEPKLPLLGIGPAKLVAAVDDQDNSLIPPLSRIPGYETHFGSYVGYRTYNMQAQVSLSGPSPGARTLKLLKGTLPVTILAEQKPEIVVENVLTVKHKKFDGPEVSLEVEEAKEGPNNSCQVQVTVRRTGKDNQQDYTWTNSLHQRIELQDDQGNKYVSQGFNANWGDGSPTNVRGSFMFGNNGTAKPGKPAKLIYYGWVTVQHPVDFEFRDLPLP